MPALNVVGDAAETASEWAVQCVAEQTSVGSAVTATGLKELSFGEIADETEVGGEKVIGQ